MTFLYDASGAPPAPGAPVPDDTDLSAAKRCTKCGEAKPAGDFYVRRAPAGGESLTSSCRPCQRATVRGSTAKAAARGRCRGCTEPRAAGRSYCATCAAKQKAQKKRLYDARAAGVFCVPCWFSGIAAVTLRDRRAAPLLRALWDAQGGRCALTGAPLTPGVNGSLDHVVARSRGGTDGPANLRWVTVDANRAKQSLSDDEFLALCRAVVAHADRPAGPPAAGCS